MLDKEIEFHRILMMRPSGAAVIDCRLPDGYGFVMYEKGDDRAWAEIESSVNEFDSRKAALSYFRKRYGRFKSELERRCLFVKSPEGKKIATLTVWWEYIGKRRYPWISWVAVMPGYQGTGIGKAVVSRGMELLIETEGDVTAFLKTQTWSYKAVNIYRRQGFDFVREPAGSDWHTDDYDRMISVMKDYLR